MCFGRHGVWLRSCRRGMFKAILHFPPCAHGHPCASLMVGQVKDGHVLAHSADMAPAWAVCGFFLVPHTTLCEIVEWCDVDSLDTRFIDDYIFFKLRPDLRATCPGLWCVVSHMVEPLMSIADRFVEHVMENFVENCLVGH